MSFQPGANVYTQGFGSRPENVEVPHNDVRAPATTDILYPIGKRWLNTVSGSEYVLASQSVIGGVTSSSWTLLGAGGTLNSLTTDDSTVVVPTNGTIKLVGNATQGVSTTGSNSPGTATITVADWTTAQKGVGVLSTDAQAIAGTGTTQAVTPHALQAKIGVQTAHGVAVGNTGATSAISWTAAGTAGQVLTGSASDPVWATLAQVNVVNVTGTSQAMAVGTTYVANNAALVTFTLPATAVLGDKIIVVGNGLGGWRIAQNAGQQIVENSSSTTAGTGGTVSSTQHYGAVQLFCVVPGASTVWNIIESPATLTFV